MEPSSLFLRHTPERNFIGPGLCQLESGEILMAAPWGRPPANFEELASKHPVPMTYKSADGGRTWRESGRMDMTWDLSGMISDGGISFLRLQDRRLGFLGHRHVPGLHGGGVPVFSSSNDEGATWAPACMLCDTDFVCYVMNDRMIQTGSGRLIVPVSLADATMDEGYHEGARSIGACFLSDDAGDSWRLSKGRVSLPEDPRGVAEPCVAMASDGRMLLLCRTGAGSNHASWSDDEGETWSAPISTSQAAACAPLTLKCLPDGRLVTFYNHAGPLHPGAFFPRNPLVYSTSDDGGESWNRPIVIDDEGEELIEGTHLQHIYPGTCLTSEGIVVIYSSHAADPKGGFGNGSPDSWQIGGGKRCILPHPSHPGRA